MPGHRRIAGLPAGSTTDCVQQLAGRRGNSCLQAGRGLPAASFGALLNFFSTAVKGPGYAGLVIFVSTHFDHTGGGRRRRRHLGGTKTAVGGGGTERGPP